MPSFHNFLLILKDNSTNKLIKCVEDYSLMNDGGFENANITHEHRNFSSITTKEKFTLFVYPKFLDENSELSIFISSKLQTKVYSFQYNRDVWDMSIFDNGQLSLKFKTDNLIENKSELNVWRKEIKKLCDVCEVSMKSVEQYFTGRSNNNGKLKAYEYDEFIYGDGEQVFDFLSKISVTYSDIINYEMQGEVYKIWTSNFSLIEKRIITTLDLQKTNRYTKGPLRINQKELESILGIPYNQFIYIVTYNQFCSNCGVANAERTQLDYYLDIDCSIIQVKGFCSNCNAPLDSPMGNLDVERLKNVLDK